MRELAATGEPLVATHLSQPAPHAVGEQPANVVHVHVGKHHVGHGCEIDAGGLGYLKTENGEFPCNFTRNREQARGDEFADDCFLRQLIVLIEKTV